MSRALAVVAGMLILLVSACGGGSNSTPFPHSQASETSSADAAEPSTALDSETAQALPSKPTHGIVVVTEDNGVVEVGMIDPADGSYAVENTFEIGDFARGVNEPGFASAVEFSMRVSPDRTRGMAQREVDGDGHTGWVTADGQFVDITAATLGQRSDFSGPVSSFGVGFNRQGDFFYGVTNGDAIEVWSLPAGQTTGQTLVRTVDLLTTYRLGAEGSLQFALEDTCDNFAAYSWMGDWYLHSDGTQIYRAPRTPAAGPCGDEGQPLLPNTNTASVADPVASPDLSEVAFIYTNDDATRSIYVVSADGSGQPRKIDNVEWPDKSANLVGWA